MIGDCCPNTTRIVGIFAVLAALALAACSPARTIEAARILQDIAAGAQPSRLKEITARPRRHTVEYRVGERAYSGDLYRPADGALSRLVLVPGITPQGKDDAKLVAFATTLARARFAVLVPDLRGLRALKVRARDADDIADAIRHLAVRDDVGGDARVGVAAVSYAVGPAIMAALSRDNRDRVKFVVAIGGYHDVEAVITFFTTGKFRETPDARWRQMVPNAYGKWIFALSNADLLPDPRDREVLSAIARRKMADLDADVGELTGALGAAGQTVYDVLVNRDPARVGSLVQQLPDNVRAEIAALDLKHRALTKLSGRLIIIHGRDDDIIPFSESVALSAAGARTDLFVIDTMAHSDFDDLGIGDGIRLWRAVYVLLSARDEIPKGKV